MTFLTESTWKGRLRKRWGLRYKGGSCAKWAILLAGVGLQEAEKMVKWVWKLASGRNNFSRLLKILWALRVASVTTLLPLLCLQSRNRRVEEGSVCSDLHKTCMKNVLWGKKLNGSNKNLVCHKTAGNIVMGLLWNAFLLKRLLEIQSLPVLRQYITNEAFCRS